MICTAYLDTIIIVLLTPTLVASVVLSPQKDIFYLFFFKGSGNKIILWSQNNGESELFYSSKIHRRNATSYAHMIVIYIHIYMYKTLRRYVLKVKRSVALTSFFIFVCVQIYNSLITIHNCL